MHPHDKDEPPTLGQIDADIGAMGQAMHPVDGMPLPMASVADPPSTPPMTSATSPCKRGPCKHLMQITQIFEAGNPAGTFEVGKEPRQRTFYCDAIAGTYIEMSNDAYPVDCNRWDPIAPSTTKALTKRREAYFERNPEQRPLSQNDLDAMFPEPTDKEPA